MRLIFIGTIPIGILIVEVMMASYSKEETTPKTSSNLQPETPPIMVLRPPQVMEATPPTC